MLKIEKSFSKNVVETARQIMIHDAKIVNNKMVHIGPYLVTPSKPPPNNFLLVAGRQVFLVPSLAESTRVACRYISIRTILIFTIFDL